MSFLWDAREVNKIVNKSDSLKGGMLTLNEEGVSVSSIKELKKKAAILTEREVGTFLASVKWNVTRLLNPSIDQMNKATTKNLIWVGWWTCLSWKRSWN